MGAREEFDKLVEKVKKERDELNLKIHLASMETKEEFKEAEKKWVQLKDKTSKITDEVIETSEDYLGKAKIIGEELKETYSRISERLSK